MRVLLVVHGFPPAALGGTELYAAAQARALARHGDDVFVLTRECDRDRDEYAVRTYAIDGVRIFGINNTYRRTRSFADIARNAATAASARDSWT